MRIEWVRIKWGWLQPENLHEFPKRNDDHHLHSAIGIILIIRFFGEAQWIPSVPDRLKRSWNSVFKKWSTCTTLISIMLDSLSAIICSRAQGATKESPIHKIFIIKHIKIYSNIQSIRIEVNFFLWFLCVQNHSTIVKSFTRPYDWNDDVIGVSQFTARTK